MKMAIICFAVGTALQALAAVFAVQAQKESNRSELMKSKSETLMNIERAMGAYERENQCWEENRRLKQREKF